jgi:hypothetical protein
LTDIIARLIACSADVQESIPDVNRGGCAVYAAQIAMALDETGATVWGVLSSALRDEDLNVVREECRPHTLHDWNAAGVYMNHVLVQFELRGTVWTHDAVNTTDAALRREPTFGGPLCPGYLTVPELVKIATSRRGWNPAFDRRTGLPIIRSAIRRHLCS